MSDTIYFSLSARGFFIRSIHGDKIPKDAIEITKEEHTQLLNGLNAGMTVELRNGKFILSPRVIPDEEIITEYSWVTQTRLDKFAGERGYYNILSAVSYISSSVPQFKKDAESAIKARDITWVAAGKILDKVKEGAAYRPKSYEEFLAKLPPLKWLDEQEGDA